MIRAKVGDVVRRSKLPDGRKNDEGLNTKMGESFEVATSNHIGVDNGMDGKDFKHLSNEDYEIISTSAPSHYAEQNGVACIDAIRAQLGRDGFIAFCRGNIAKYNWRLLQKESAKADADKLADYARMLAKELEQ